MSDYASLLVLRTILGLLAALALLMVLVLPRINPRD